MPSDFARIIPTATWNDRLVSPGRWESGKMGKAKEYNDKLQTVLDRVTQADFI